MTESRFNGPSVWVEDRDWYVPAIWDVCSHPRCKGMGVAVQLKRARNGRLIRYYRCPDHLYSRRIEDGHVLVEVLAGSPAAERGWTGREAFKR